MFESCLDDKDVYLSLENYIYSEFNKSCKNDKWEQPFFNTKFSNGDSFCDGNPIFSAKNLNKDFLVKIIIDDDIHSDILSFETDFNAVPMYVYEIGLEDIEKNISIILDKILSLNL